MLNNYSGKYHFSFIERALTTQDLSEIATKYSLNDRIGAAFYFTGQVRADHNHEKVVTAIEFTAYIGMATEYMDTHLPIWLDRFKLVDISILHSLGRINSGSLCFIVSTASSHRSAAARACSFIVNQVKKELPVWGKEIFEDESFEWKKNN